VFEVLKYPSLETRDLPQDRRLRGWKKILAEKTPRETDHRNGEGEPACAAAVAPASRPA
jgi:hypothetical protein